MFQIHEVIYTLLYWSNVSI